MNYKKINRLFCLLVSIIFICVSCVNNINIPSSSQSNSSLELSKKYNDELKKRYKTYNPKVTFSKIPGIKDIDLKSVSRKQGFNTKATIDSIELIPVNGNTVFGNRPFGSHITTFAIQFDIVITGDVLNLPPTDFLLEIKSVGSCGGWHVEIPGQTGGMSFPDGDTATSRLTMVPDVSFYPNGPYTIQLSAGSSIQSNLQPFTIDNIQGFGRGLFPFNIPGLIATPNNFSAANGGFTDITVNNISGDYYKLEVNGNGQHVDLVTCDRGFEQFLRGENGIIRWSPPANFPSGTYELKASLVHYPSVFITIQIIISNSNQDDLIPPSSFELTGPDSISNKYSPSFDYAPSTNIETEPGAVSVIYTNESKIRLSKNNFGVQSVQQDNNNGHGNDPDNCDPSNPGKSKTNCERIQIIASNPEYAKALNKILKKYKIHKASYSSLPNETEAQLDEALNRVSQYSITEIPHKNSIHFYNFPENVDTKTISSELRKLPFVRTAYPSVIVKTSSFTKVGSQGQSDITYSGTKPNDPEFGLNEQFWWWHFNRHKVFQAWDVYKDSFGVSSLNDAPSPRIAVIDSGFDITDPSNNDRPLYEGGAIIEADFDPTSPESTKVTEINSSNFNLLEETPDDLDRKGSKITDFSHGSWVSSIIASPFNNNKRLSGVIPTAKIIPIKFRQRGEGPFVKAINYAASKGVDSMNLSWSMDELPLSFNPTIGAAIFYASFNGSIFGGKKQPVILCAGNDSKNLDDFAPCSDYPNCVYYGQILVGGSDKNGGIWHIDATGGSNYGKAVHLAAGAHAISASLYYPARTTNRYKFEVANGTSAAAPMVASIVAMIKKMDLVLWDSPDNIMHLLAFSATIGRTGNNTLLGKNLDISERNTGLVANLRDLNMYNALIVAKNLHSSKPFLIRIFNTEGKTKLSLSNNLSNSIIDGDNTDSFYSHDGSLSDETIFNLFTNNQGKTSTFGYQIYNEKYLTITERLLGVQARFAPWQTTPLYNTSTTLPVPAVDTNNNINGSNLAIPLK